MSARRDAVRVPIARGLFITGTDTGVGKTLVAAALAAWCRQQRIDVGVAKPVATGGVGRPGALVSTDVPLLIRAAGVSDSPRLVNPVCYADPLAPYAAAVRARRPVRWSAMVSAVRVLSRRHRLLIVEGVGGWLVPITARRCVSDLARALGWPVLIVARLRLGTFNHTLLTVEQARRDGVPILGVLLNAAEPPGGAAARLAEASAVRHLPALLPVPVLGVLPHRSGLAQRPSQLAAWLQTGVRPPLLDWLRRHSQASQHEAVGVIDSPRGLC
jgi:dethiobiotin synthetase